MSRIEMLVWAALILFIFGVVMFAIDMVNDDLEEAANTPVVVRLLDENEKVIKTWENAYRYAYSDDGYVYLTGINEHPNRLLLLKPGQSIEIVK